VPALVLILLVILAPAAASPPPAAAAELTGRIRPGATGFGSSRSSQRR
jgi:hypothetical protein